MRRQAFGMALTRLAIGMGMLTLLLAVHHSSRAAAPATLPQRTILVVGANQSFNWAGYNQGMLEKGKTFHQIAANWIIPAAHQHQANEAEYSSTWIGFGGGCVDAACTVTDPTLIQAGIEQDITPAGRASYYAWYELVPAPLIQTPLAVQPGQQVRVEIAEGTPEVWTITIQNVTTGQAFTTTVPYTSTYATAEWVLETPVVITTNPYFVQVGPLPNLSVITFDRAQANRTPAALVPTEEMQLLNFSGQVLVTPSAPDLQADGFHVCTYRASCGPP